jgi:hypothetical protein
LDEGIHQQIQNARKTIEGRAKFEFEMLWSEWLILVVMYNLHVDPS